MSFLPSDSTPVSDAPLTLQDEIARLQRQVLELTTKNAEYARSGEVLRMIVEGTASATSSDFLQVLVQKLAAALGVRYAFITECTDPKPVTQATRLRTLAFWVGQGFGENFEYALTGTPCERVTGEKSCGFYPSDIQALFPEDQDLVELQAESYIGIPLLDSSGNLMGHLAALDDKPMENRAYLESIMQIFTARAAAEMERKQVEEALRESAEQLTRTLDDLKQTQSRLVHSEKMSALGQLVAGIAHEINNPITFIHGNIFPAQDYVSNLLSLLDLYQTQCPDASPAIQEKIDAIDLDFLREDLVRLLASMQVGTERILEIVRSLKIFSRLDEAGMKVVNIHEGIDSTLLLLERRLNAVHHPTAITVVKEYNPLPPVECYAGPLNQVLMNILSNAIDALEEAQVAESNHNAPATPMIRIRTDMIAPDRILIAVADNGIGMDTQVQNQLFNPFFTTKPVGKGTGLGLSISYQIIVEKHHGSLQCQSTPGKGTEFFIELPIRPVAGS